MTPVIPCSTSNISLIPGVAFTRRKNNCSTRCCNLRTKQTSYAQELVFPLSTSIRFFPRIRTFGLHHKPRFHVASATGIDVAVEQPDSPVEDKESGKDVGISPVADTGEKVSSKEVTSSTQSHSKRTRPIRKSDLPPVKNEELVPGATFTGKVRSIQPFGAFIDFGAFTDGLVHVSQLSDSFVKDVGSVVSLGQEVTVRLVEANTETGRISLTMRASDDSSKQQQPNGDNDKSRPPRRNTNQRKDDMKASKFVKGQELDGKVKNLARAGAFISLPDGEEGFLPTEEEADDGLGSLMGASTLQVDQEVRVRVLRTARGRVTLTMKKEEDLGAIDSKLSSKIVHTATNPFLLAFRKNKDIAAFLDDKEKKEDSTEQLESSPVPSALVETLEDDEQTENEVDVEAGTAVDASPAVIAENEEAESKVPDSLQTAVTVVGNLEINASEEKESDDESQIGPLIVDTAVNPIHEATPAAAEVNLGESEVVIGKDERQEEPPVVDNVDQISELAPTVEEVEIKESEETIAKEEPQTEPPTVDTAVNPINETATATSEVEIKESLETVANYEPQTEPLIAEPKVSAPISIEDEKVESSADESTAGSGSNGQIDVPLPEKGTSKGTISPALVKQLRNETGAGMMDCKNALSETGGDIVKAREYLRKKGLASADKKASRATAEGRIGSYIHDGRIGVLIEANCETDFVSRGEIFKELVDDLAMQVAACPQVQYVNTEDVPKETVEKEKELEMQREDLLSKPEQIRAKIVEGRINKRLEELALLEQPYIKNDKVVVRDIVKQTIALIGENMKVNRFVRFNLGEGLEKKSVDFAAEVAAQTAAKQAPAPPKEQPAVTETKESDKKEPPKATISAALVKQLREESGAGMMDCKKALSETGGDLAKAQEYLRKKGLSAADKKSSRIAAEGRIGSYIHDARIGVLIEVNCETDFVGRSKEFRELVDDLAMQVVASSQVQYVSVEDIPESIVGKEKELEMQREDILSKPENIREKIVEGRVSKRLNELALLEQPFIKDDKILVKDLVKLTVATLGENVKVRRFVRFTLGEASDAKPETEA